MLSGNAALRSDDVVVRPRLLRRTRRNAAARQLAGVALFFLLAGCADTPKEYNPIEWGRSAVSGIESLFGADKPESPPIVDAPPAEGRPYPNLASVPKPLRTTPEQRAQRQADVERLAKDRDAALADDQALRSSGTPPSSPPSSTAEAPPSPEPKSSAPSATPGTPPSTPPSVARAAPPAATAAPAPAAPPVAAAPVAAALPVAPAPVATVARRVGSLSFARDGASLSAAGDRALAEAANLARANNGRIRLVAGQVARQTIAPELARARTTAIAQALSRAGIAAARLNVDEAQGRRVDLYDIYVEN